MRLSTQLAYLFILALPVASIAWTVTHEEVFREPREWCKDKSQNCHALVPRKFFYLFTCEYCFSHYVAALFLLITQFQMLYEGWRGYLVAWFALVWVANVYMGFFNRLRLDIKHENVAIAVDQTKVNGDPPPPIHKP
ncbi:hypothetical protein [Edaphobacter modestus]|uniref:Uncharacterized protein n=1 Tax=Edaphobacter modestus TaxID=388466 RepID=A0A4Q7YT99_9BACT|nr:hypothetical protein [Edaphobacter modestus]RZU40977.1 hypothetical protein BDD14_2468 [Edaphobacter modestus]